MENLEKLRLWLRSFPGWEGQLSVDYTDAAPINSGLYPLGVEEVSRREDLLGGVTVRCRSRYELRRVSTGQQDSTDPAAWLLAFQDWVRAQSAAHLAPTFGDEPHEERIRAEKGKLQKADQTGTGTYAVTLTAEYTKKYETQED